MRIGIDVGGTHTDAVLLDEHEVVAATKVLTTENVRDGIVNALDEILAGSGAVQSAIDAVMIGTTQFTNAVVQRADLAATAIIRIALPSGERVPPMIDWPEDIADALGRHVYMVHGGKTYDGHPIAPLSDTEIDAVIDDIAAKGVRQIAVSGVFSPSDPEQEERVTAHVLERIRDARVTPSHVIGRLGLLERENAALLNASLQPLARRVVRTFADALRYRQIRCPFYISQNDGTLMSAEFAAKFPALTFASGPTNSLRGASLLTALENAVVVDIGGTTSDIGVLHGGFPRQSNIAIEVGGVRTNFRMPDILSIGLGGGSLVSDQGRTIGPRSVGYRLVEDALVFGGKTLTLTDIAVAAGLAGIGDAARVKHLDRQLVQTAVARMQCIINQGIDRMKGSREAVPLVLVGGGAVLLTATPGTMSEGMPELSGTLSTASEIHRPDHSGVANAIGAANANIGSETECIVCYRRTSRDEVLDELTTALRVKLINAGAEPDTIRLADVDETSISYMADESTRLRVKMVGELRFGRHAS